MTARREPHLPFGSSSSFIVHRSFFIVHRSSFLYHLPVPSTDHAAVALRHTRLWIALAFLLPNLVTVTGGFLYDDLSLVVEDATIHSLSGLEQIWTEPFWADRPLLTLYRPITKTAWLMVWLLGGGSPIPFHFLNLLLGTVIVLLLHEYLLELEIPPRVAFLAAFLFALFPIHVEATAPIFGSAELLAGAFALGALLLHRRNHRVLALVLFALAVYSKESAAALAAIGFLAIPGARRRYWADGLAAAAIVVSMLVVRSLVSTGMEAIPAADNPMSLQSPVRRVISALWVQSLYLWKTYVPIHLSVEYSYKQIPLVVKMSDPRAIAGVAFLLASIWIAWKKRVYAPGVLAWWILFLPTANLLYPIGTMMAERLAYLPSAGAALVLATWLAKRKTLREPRNLYVLLAVVFLLYGGRTFVRNLVWTDADRFYAVLVADAPNSARAHFGRGVYLASKGKDAEAVEEYRRATEILPSFADAHFNRANALIRLGRDDEAIEAYKRVVRLAPGQTPAEQNLLVLLSGGEVKTEARRVE